MAKQTLRETFNSRKMLLDGAMGTMIQRFGGDVKEIHHQYLLAGADIITTDTFNGPSVEAVRLAREAVEDFMKLNPDASPRYVVGDVGPTNKMLSMSDNADDPAYRSVTFDEMEARYTEWIESLVKGGVDGILLETCFDTLNVKAAISAYQKVKETDWAYKSNWSNKTNWANEQEFPPLLISMTVSDASGRTLSGQTVEAFTLSVMHGEPLCIGMNCGLGAKDMVPLVRRIKQTVDKYYTCETFVSCHPNAGLPNAMGGYDDTPAQMTEQMQPMLDEDIVDMIGGCCGTTPSHIAAMRKMLNEKETGETSLSRESSTELTLTGLEPLTAGSDRFIKVGERCNVAGSRKFLRLINEKKYDEALEIARLQIEKGADCIDVNMDDGLLDAKAEMRTFLNMIASDPAISRVPIMVDSSRWEVIEEGLKCCQGKCIVNSISLKNGEKEFLEHARVIRRLGAAVIVMCFDEEGQATNYERRIRIMERAYRLLTEEVGFCPTDIIFDPNVLTVATGMAEHNDYAHDFIRATRWAKDNLPGTRISGGLSNLSFAFRGNNYLRESMHSVFLHLAMPEGMGMAIMNPGTAVRYETIPAELRLAIIEVLLNTSPEAAESLIAMAAQGEEALKGLADKRNAGNGLAADAARTVANAGADARTVANAGAESAKETSTPEKRLEEALLKGTTATLNDDLQTLMGQGKTALEIISGPLMSGMNKVGKLFGEGKMFLPQVVKTARTMKKAVEIVMGGASIPSEVKTNGRIVIATVKGDVHDIGKNIVSVVLQCNGFEVIDLGVMVPTETIIQTAIDKKADIVCLSGLITPSLEEMCNVAKAMQEAGLTMPLIVGGATTSEEHTRLRIAPLYPNGKVIHVRDAAQNPVVAMQLLHPDEGKKESLAEGKKESVKGNVESVRSNVDSIEHVTNFTLSDIIPQINWQYFFMTWRVKAEQEEAKNLKADAEALLKELASDSKYDMRVKVKFLNDNDEDNDDRKHLDAVLKDTPMRQYVNAGDNVGMFAVTVSEAFIKRLEALKAEAMDDYAILLLQSVGDLLAEAASEHLSVILKRDYNWGGIRPAIGYPSLPDIRRIFDADKVMHLSNMGISLTENGAMYPQASVCGLLINNPEAKY